MGHPAFNAWLYFCTRWPMFAVYSTVLDPPSRPLYGHSPCVDWPAPSDHRRTSLSPADPALSSQRILPSIQRILIYIVIGSCFIQSTDPAISSQRIPDFQFVDPESSSQRILHYPVNESCFIQSAYPELFSQWILHSSFNGSCIIQSTNLALSSEWILHYPVNGS